MKYHITHRHSGYIIYTADIEADNDTPESIKLGLAAKEALKTNRNILAWACLKGADLRKADLTATNLSWTDLSDSNLRGARLAFARLDQTILRGANLRGVDLFDIIANSSSIRTIFTGTYTVVYTSEIIQIGCERHSIADWWSFSDEEIEAMDAGQKAINFWRIWKPILQLIISSAPALPTDYIEPAI
jgi:Pentapeptide repeats (8 copies)